MGRIKLSEETKQEILKISYRYTSAKLAKMYNCSRSTILKIWMDNDYKKGTSNTYYVNQEYFKDINTENKAYVLGFLASDGTLYKRERKSGLIQIKLQESDEQILRDILADMDSDYPVKKVKNGRFRQVLFSITSQNLYEQLLNIGLCPDKTWKLNLKSVISHIPKEFYIDFIRGYFDGDGCITKMNNNIISKVTISFCCPYKFGLELQDLLRSIYEIESIVNIDKHRKYTNEFCNVYIHGTTNKYKLLKLMYYDGALCLERKYNRAKQTIKAIELNLTNRSENIMAIKKFYESQESR